MEYLRWKFFWGSAQRGSVTCPKSHSKLRKELRLEFRPQDAQSKACSSLYQLLHTQSGGGRHGERLESGLYQWGGKKHPEGGGRCS